MNYSWDLSFKSRKGGSASAVITSISAPSNGIYTTNSNNNNGNALTFTVTFNQAVTVNTGGGTPYIDITLATYGNTNARAAYVSGSGTTALIFTYTIQEDDEDDGGIACDAEITLNGGTITSSGNNATLTFTAPDLSAVYVYGVVATFGWMDATVSASVIRSGTAVSQWEDISGNDRHLDVQSTGSAQPTYNATGGSNNLAYLGFDGSDFFGMSSYYSLAGGTNRAWYVSKRNAEGSGVGVFMGTAAGTACHHIFYSGTPGSIIFISRTTNAGATSTGNTNTNWQLLTGEREGINVSMSVNSGTPATNTNGQDQPNIDAMTMGSRPSGTNRLVGGICEAIHTNISMTSTQVNVINHYLMRKYAIA